MTDRELLGFAANAAGINAKSKRDGVTRYFSHGVEWNPLTDDGDALRLAVKLCFSIAQSTSVIEVLIGEDLIHRFVALQSTNRLEATRRAIVRAAAEIGKGME